MSREQQNQAQTIWAKTKRNQRKENEQSHQIKNQPRPEKENRTENALVLATELTNKIKKVEEIMKALQNKESESYPCVFTGSSVKGREKENEKSELKKTTHEEAIGGETQTG